jgi:hypothetical protein
LRRFAIEIVHNNHLDSITDQLIDLRVLPEGRSPTRAKRLFSW